MDDQSVQSTPTDESVNESQNEGNLTTEEPQEAQETSTESVEQPEQPVQQTEPQQQTVEASDEEDEYVPFTPSLPPEEVGVPQFDLSQVQPGEDGMIDAGTLANAFNTQLQQAVQAATKNAATMVREAEEKRLEENMWQKARDKYPKLKSDKTLAQEVQSLRYGMFLSEINEGKQARMLTPTQAYERLNKRIEAAKNEGVKQATESVRVQESAYVEPTSNASKATAGNKEALYQKMRSPIRSEAESAQRDILKNLLFGSE